MKCKESIVGGTEICLFYKIFIVCVHMYVSNFYSWHAVHAQIGSCRSINIVKIYVSIYVFVD